MAKILSRCPVCENPMDVSELRCRRCKTTVHGSFDTCRFCRLAPEQLAFIELFLRCEGNLSRVEKELNLSYPTVRNRFQTALVALGFAEDESSLSRRDVSVEELLDSRDEQEANGESSLETIERRRSVLESLAQGEISVEDAAEALRDLS